MTKSKVAKPKAKLPRGAITKSNVRKMLEEEFGTASPRDKKGQFKKSSHGKNDGLSPSPGRFLVG